MPFEAAAGGTSSVAAVAVRWRAVEEEEEEEAEAEEFIQNRTRAGLEEKKSSQNLIRAGRET